jgi:hypothetical protein
LENLSRIKTTKSNNEGTTRRLIVTKSVDSNKVLPAYLLNFRDMRESKIEKTRITNPAK